MLPFESEQSLGPTGDGLFLELRHKILIAQNAPGQAEVAMIRARCSTLASEL